MKTINGWVRCAGIAALFIFLVFSGCQKSGMEGVDLAGSAVPDLSTKVSSSASGFVTDENDGAVINALVQFGSATVFTNKYGFFEFKNVEVVKDAAVVTVTKAGYFKGIKTFSVKEGKAGFTRIKLLPKTIAGTVVAAAGGTVSLPNGLKIAFPANAVVNAATNVAYTGTFNVAAQWLNPAGSDLDKIMPGDLRGINAEGKVQLLTTFGMAAVELRGSAGELLQIATGKTADLTFPLPSSLSASAPATIPLWSFNEVNGLWKEEGVATKSGGVYSGKVSHFSFWNCDVPSNFVWFECTVLVTGGQPFSNAMVKITQVGNPANVRSSGTNAAGYAAGAIPSNTQLKVEIYDPCGTMLHSQTITTTNQNINLGNISVTAPNLANISGTVTNCSNQPVANGIVYLQSGNSWLRYPVTNGAYSFTQSLCGSGSATFDFAGEDFATGQAGNPVTHTIVTGTNTIPVLQACGNNVAQFINCLINGAPYDFPYPSSELNCYSIPGVPGGLGVQGLALNPNRRVSMNTSGGSASACVLNYFDIDVAAINDSLGFPTSQAVTITEYPALAGQYFAGSFSATFVGKAPANIVYNVNCNFRVKRNQ